MVQLRPDEAAAYLASRSGVLGPGWREVDTFDGIDLDEYEDEEEEYVTLDLGSEMDPRYLQTEGSYQLIGMDTPLPHLKMGSTVLQGEITPLIGSEVILGLIRNQENPLRPSHPPMYTTSHRITFTPITLYPKNASDPPLPEEDGVEETEGLELDRPMFLIGPAKQGPNAPPVLPGRKRDRDRAARRAERLEKTGSGETMDIEDERGDNIQGDRGEEGQTTPEPTTEAGEFSSPIPIPLPTSSPIASLRSPSTPAQSSRQAQASDHGQGSDWSSWTPRFSAVNGPIGRPRTRPMVEIESLAELANVDLEKLAPNVRVLVSPLVIYGIDHPPKTDSPSTSTASITTDPITNATSAPMTDAMHVPTPTRPLEYTRTQLKKLIIQAGFGPNPTPIKKSRAKAPKSPTTEGDGEEATTTPQLKARASKGGKRRPQPRTGETDAIIVTVDDRTQSSPAPGPESDTAQEGGP